MAIARTIDTPAYVKAEAAIIGRYRVVPRGHGFWGWCVVAGSGSAEIFAGHKGACERVAQALQTAALDGAYLALRLRS